jgi:hypothetical protein
MIHWMWSLILGLYLWQNTHQQVKAKILERMESWTEMFASNADFGIMEQAYMKLKTQSMFPSLERHTDSLYANHDVSRSEPTAALKTNEAFDHGYR